MFKKALLALALVVSATGASYAQTAGQAVTGFLLDQGSTYGSFTCPAAFTSPCFVQYGSTIPISGSITANLSGFTPTAGATASLSATGTSADVALPAGTDVVVSSPSTNTVPVFIRLQAGAGTAVTSDLPVNPGAAVGFHITTQTHISGITGGTAATLQIQGGTGLATGYGGGGSGSVNASVGTNSSANPASSTQIGVSDGTNLQKVVAPIGLADGVNGNNSISTGGYVWNGTTWDRMPGTTAGVKVSAASLPLPTGAATSANQSTEITSLATIATNSGSAIPAGSAIIGKVGIDQTTPGTTNAVQPIPGTSGGLTTFYLTAAASTNATNVKASAGQLYRADLSNNSATPAYVSFYNNSGTPTCGTGIVYQMMIPANSTSGAGWVSAGSMGLSFSSGIGICVTTGIAGTGSVAASAYTISLGYK